MVGGIVAVVVLGAGMLVFQQQGKPEALSTTASPTPTPTSTPTATPKQTSTIWSFTGSSWQPSGSAPACADPFSLASPTDVTKATSILYPGQVRGGNYKPHGGFRFDKATDNNVKVSLSLDATLLRGSRYIETGTVQYMLDFVTSCGYFLRYDHLLTLTDEFKTLVDAPLPEAKENASATTAFSSYPTFKQGTVIATSVGFEKPSRNVSFDFGVYDLRHTNDASKVAAFQNKVGSMKELSYFGVCWLDMLPANDASFVRNLPGSGTEGTSSDYCK